jgi:hypothetical protein
MMLWMASNEDSIKWLQRRTEQYRSYQSDRGEVVDDFDEVGKLGSGFVPLDDLEEVDLGDGITKRPTYVSTKLTLEQKGMIHDILREFSDCFAWSYTEMLGLSRSLAEHQLPIKPRFRPYKQLIRNFSPEIVGKIKEKVGRLLQAGFVHPCRYADWVSNVVPVEKKNMGKIQVCVDFRNLNRATPKDEYPMPVAEILVNSASGNKMISFLDGRVQSSFHDRGGHL